MEARDYNGSMTVYHIPCHTHPERSGAWTAESLKF